MLLIVPTLSFAKDPSFAKYFADDLLMADFPILFINEDGEVQEYKQPSVSCLFNSEFFTKQLLYCNKNADPKGIDALPCATARYEKLACQDKNWNIKEKKKRDKYKKKRAEEDRKRQAEKKENDCINESARAMNDFTAKKIYSRCMKRK